MGTGAGCVGTGKSFLTCCGAVQKEPLPHPVANGAPLSPNPTDSLICGSNTTYKMLARCTRDLITPQALPVRGWFGHFKPRARLTRGLKTEAGARHFVGLMACGMA